IMFNFDSYLQAKNRLEQLKAIGHNTSKTEIIIMGGTFPSMPKKYQENFVKGIFDALNERKSKNLDEAKKLNKTAKQRCVGLTIETRPDYCNEKHIKQMLYLGATRVEVGVQILNDKIYIKTKRGHKIEDVARATELLKNSGLKIVYHIMPGLGTEKEDLEAFKLLFNDERFFPDMLKIYPVLIIKGTELYDLWKDGKYKPLDENKAVKLICKLKQEVPEFVRIMRIQRDISKEKIIGGVQAGNLRELVENEMEEQKIRCNCIRCREVGHRIYKNKDYKLYNKSYLKENTSKNKYDSKYIKINTIKYKSSKGEEFFVSLVDKNNILYGYLRLRILNKNCDIIT
ncbi:MAG: tRNA uridine(34) 5-carboxymethylaminomethyl modification radical SAM/GNAT enzyme Elp3, partial [Candidatus Aenigmarchaeota archaeon]|nr:tRNA uridine(34) 5-carboxymethylaminomethyl modification radical SAM/GNAT enzyme Elp3 [Candidatus Aenigmarchaeota archaeon]